MIELGRYNRLQVMRIVEHGAYLNAGEIGDVLLPRRYMPSDVKEGDEIDVFLYLDNQERLIATTQCPKIQVGGFAMLEVKWTNEWGAFLDWGLMKDLFCPFAEQSRRMRIGEKHFVYCFVDRKSYRIMASAKIDRFLQKADDELCSGELVRAMIWGKSDMGYKAIVNDRYSGLIFANETFGQLNVGDEIDAWIKKIRMDGKLDLKLQQHFGKKRVEDFSDILLDYLKAHKACELTDDSDPQDIYELFAVSKKTYKRGIGMLLKRGLIIMNDNEIRLK